MKRLFQIAAVAFLCLTTNVSGQGLVYFGNAYTISGWNPAADRLVYWDASTYPQKFSLVASNSGGLDFSTLRAALYYSSTSNFDISTYKMASGGPATFRASTSANAGSWFGGLRTLDNIPPGTTANMIVLVWDSSVAADPLSGAYVGVWGVSPRFQYTPPTNTNLQLADMLLNNLSSFSIGTYPFDTPFYKGPYPQTVIAGDSATFSIQIYSGVSPFSYTWKFNGTNIPDATTTSLTITNAQPANAGPYSIVVANSYGTNSSSPVNLTVIFPQLSINRLSSTQAQISWLTNLNAYNLQSASNLGSSWTTVTNPPVVQSNRFLLNETFSGEKYYRLRKP